MTAFLAFDTTTSRLSVSLFAKGEYFHREVEAGQRHTALLLPAIESLLAQAGCALSALTGIAVTEGPGSFTGVRIGLATAQGLALPHDTPLYPVSSLAALAQAAAIEPPLEGEQAAVFSEGVERVFCALDARMGQVYTGFFDTTDPFRPLPITAMALHSPEAVVLPTTDALWGLYGAGFAAYPALQQLGATALLSDSALPRARAVLELAMRRWQDGDPGVSAEAAQALYLRNQVATPKRSAPL